MYLGIINPIPSSSRKPHTAHLQGSLPKQLTYSPCSYYIKWAANDKIGHLLASITKHIRL